MQQRWLLHPMMATTIAKITTRIREQNRSYKVAQVHIFVPPKENTSNRMEAYDRDREQDLVSEVSPHADGTIFRREIVVIICHNKYHLSS